MFRQQQKRIQRAYTTIVVVVTTAAGAYAINQRAAQERAAAARAAGEVTGPAAPAGSAFGVGRADEPAQPSSDDLQLPPGFEKLLGR
jgi:hypothetical protein